jgi:hypothetical protein
MARHLTDLHRAARLYRAFREEQPSRTRSIARPRIPKALAHIGTCEFIGYITSHKGRPALYVHYFAPGSRPSMYGSTGLGEFYLLGGRYKLTAGGITDLDAHGRIVDYRPRFKVVSVNRRHPGRLSSSRSR